MVDIATLGLEIRSDGVVVASDRLKRLTEDGGKAESATARLASSFDRLKGYITAAAAALGLWKLADMVKDAALLSARYDTLGAAMGVVGNNAGYTSKQMGEFQAKLQQTGIAMIEARQSLTMMASAHIDLSKSAQLARIAQDAAVIGGINSSEAFERMVRGIQSGETEVLKTIGINVNFEQSYQKLAQQLGKTSQELSETEKVTARTNAVMNKGKDIAGAYEAAMDTAGKQITSMQRYIDNLKVVLGSVFNDALIVLVTQFTGGLKQANTEAEKLQQEGKLKQWGRDLVMTMAGVADAIRIVINGIATFTGAAVAGMMQIYKVGEAIARLATGNLSGAGQSIQDALAYGQAYIDDMKKRWTEKSFTTTATEMFAQRDANAAADKAKKEAAEQKRIEAGNQARAEEAAKAALITKEKGLEKELEALKTEKTAENDIAKRQADIQLSILKDQFDQQLVSSEDYYNRVQEIQLASAQKQFDEAAAYLAKEEELLVAIGNAYGTKSDKYTKELNRNKQAVAALQEAELEYAKVYIETQQQKEAAARKVEEAVAANVLAMKQAQIALDVLNGANKEAADAELKLVEGLSKEEALRKELARVGATATSDVVNRLNAEIQLQSTLNQRLRDEIALRERKGVLTGQITGYDNGKAIYANQFYNQQQAGRYISDTELTGGGAAADSYWAPADWSVNYKPKAAYATGTPYVPETGLYLLHQGEKVTPANRNDGSGVSIGEITIVTQATDADSIAREIVPALAKYMNRRAA